MTFENDKTTNAFKISAENWTTLKEKSIMIKGLASDVPMDATTQVTLQNIDGHQYVDVLSYLSLVRANAGQSADDFAKTLVASMADYTGPQVLRLMNAADYLNISDLLDCSCQAAADRMKGKTVEEIRKEFGIKNDLTSEQEEAIRNENRWAFEDDE